MCRVVAEQATSLALSQRRGMASLVASKRRVLVLDVEADDEGDDVDGEVRAQ